MSDKEDIKILSIESIPIIRKYIDASDQQIANEIDERMRDYVSEKIEVIGAGISIFTSTVFTRRNEKPNKPTGGSYNTPLPNESIWSDGIPDGREILWASTRVFASDNGKMQQSEWSEPSKMTDTADFEALYSSAELPKTLKDGFSKDQYGNIDKDWLAANSDWHDEPGSDEIWMATNTAKNGVWGTWAISKIKGENGLDGKDGDNVEFIYYLTNVEFAPPTPESLKDLEELEKLGWSDHPTGVSETQRFEYFSMRKKLSTDVFFGNWSTPALWAKYGENGKDGDGLEYVYKTTKTNSAPKLTIPYYWEYDELYQKEEYIPSDWTDDPTGVDEINLYEWVSSRKYNGTTKKWGRFSEPKIWAKYGENGKDGLDGKDGEQGPAGEPGKLGKVVYPAGEFDESKTYTSTETKTPYVIDTDKNYYVLKSEKYSSIRHPKDAANDWEKFESFEAIYAKIAMIDNGTIGSAVYSGDFMFSQQGVDKDGNASPVFEKFKPEHIYDSESEFKPNICMNFKTGEMNACCGNVHFDKQNITLKADNTLIDGNLNISGLTFKNKKILTSDNIGDYLLTLDEYSTYLNLKKTGGWIELQGTYGSNDEYYNWFSLPSFHPSNTLITDETKDEIRSYLGCNIIIYNNSTSNMHLCGSYKLLKCQVFNSYSGELEIWSDEPGDEPTTGACFGSVIMPGQFISATCKQTLSSIYNIDYLLENVYWECSIGWFKNQ